MPPHQNKIAPQSHEFDIFIKNYRDDRDEDVSLSGETSAFFAEYKAQKLHEWFPEYRNHAISILDFGCGDGLMTELVQKTFPLANVHGIDPSAKSIEEAQANFSNAKFAWFDGTRTPFANNSIDLVFAAGVFHHIPFEQHQASINEIFRILKPDGRFVLFELNPINPLTQVTFRRSPIEYNARMLFPRYAQKLVLSQGVLDTKYYCFFPRFARRLRFLERYMTWICFGALYAVIVKK